VITEGELTIAESGAIIEYVLARHGEGRLIPAAGTPDRMRFTYWLHFAEGTAMTPLLMRLVFNRVETSPMPFFVRPIAKKISATVKRTFIDPEIAQQLNYMESEIGRTGWFAGAAFSAADMQMSFPLEAAASRGGLNDDYPKLVDFLQRIHARPAYQRALERGGPYELLS
jgi:glutathione S-transferase